MHVHISHACQMHSTWLSTFVSRFERATHFAQYVNNSYGTKQSCRWYFTEKRIMASFISMVQSLSCGQVWILYSFSEAQMKTANLHGGRRAQRIRTCLVSVKSYQRFSRQPGLARNQHTYTNPAFPPSMKTFLCRGQDRYASHDDQPNLSAICAVTGSPCC